MTTLLFPAPDWPTLPVQGADARFPVRRVFCVGRNYAAHAAEFDNDVPATPMMFLKPNTSVVGPGEPIVYPTQTKAVDHEAELAVVIGRICKDVPAERAAEVIFG